MNLYQTILFKKSYQLKASQAEIQQMVTSGQIMS
jgi:hypothetical protein